MITKFNKDLSTHIEVYSAYVYRIIITFLDGTKKIYIGAHKGSIYDSYDFSSEDGDFLRDLRNPDTEVYFEIVMKGTEYDMFDLENQMLEKVDAKNNDEYYNKTNGGSRYTEQSAAIEAYIDSIIEKCNNGTFDKYIQYLSVEYVAEQIDKTIQIRTLEEKLYDEEYCKPIADQIDLVHNGDTSFLPPCLALGDWGTKKDGILWEDGSQRFGAVSMSKRGKTIKTIVLPKKEYKKIADKVGEITQGMIDLAVLRNPHDPSPKLMKPAELSKLIFERSGNLDDIKSARQLRFLAKGNRIGTTAEKIISGAVDIWNNQEEAKKRGKDFHYYHPTSEEGKQILIEGKTKYREGFEDEDGNVDDIIWGPYSSATFGPEHIFGLIQKRKFDKHKYPTMIVEDLEGKVIRPIIYHTTTKDQREWEKGKGESVRQLLEHLSLHYNFDIAPYHYISLIAKRVVSKATK